MSFHRVQQLFKFYAAAQTKYQIHSPFVFELVSEVLEDDRFFYAFEDVERVREEMLRSNSPIEITDFGAGTGGSNDVPEGRPTTRVAPLHRIAARAGSPLGQAWRLFRLAHFLKPATMLELGTSVGISAMYLASAARDAAFFTLEGCPNCAEIARINLDILKLKQAQVVTGPFENTLLPTLERLQKVDFAFFDGNHRREPTLRYFEAALPFAHEKSVFVFDDIYWSAGMTEAWREIQQHPRVTLTVDFFDLSLAFFNPDFREKQHLRVVPAAWKPWKVF